VSGRTLVLGGVDVVDGSPVLDIKPYAPYTDALPAARCPAWVTVSAPAACLLDAVSRTGRVTGMPAQADAGENEPLQVGPVVICAEAQVQLEACWKQRAK
jgi:hypothetical protein